MREGLKQLPKDKRDFRFGAVFKFVILDEDFVFDPLVIFDQKETDFCSAFAVCAVSEAQEGVVLAPEWQFAKEKEMEGDWMTYGADLRTTCKTIVGKGSLEAGQSPYNVNNSGRDFLADWDNWPKDLDDKAVIHRKQAYFSVDNNFNAIRGALGAFKNERRAVLTGALWRQSWTECGGVIPETYEKDGMAHAFCFIGQKKINGKWHLVARLSNGKIGDNGLFYFPEKVVNKECRFGNYMFADLPPELTKEEIIQKSKITIMQKMVELLKQVIHIYEKIIILRTS